MRTTVLHSSGLHFQYPRGKSMHFPDIALLEQNSVLLLGPSGCGKSTYLHMCCGLVRNYTGSIRIAGHALESFSGKALDRHRAKYIGIVLQYNIFVHALTVLENLLLFQQLSQGKGLREDCIRLLSRLGLEKYKNKKTYELSGGEQQRLSVARAIVHKPKLILADEPTAALDDAHAFDLARLLMELTEETHAALLIATHDARLKEIVSHQIVLS